MKLAFITIFITLVLVLVKVVIPYTKFKKHSKIINNIYNTSLPLIAILLSFYTLWIGEEQSERRPNLVISIDCKEFQSPNSSGDGDLYNYYIYLTNVGNIDAKVIYTKLEISTNHIFRSEENDMQFTIPVGGSQRIFKEDGKKMNNPDFLIANHYVSYTSGNGNGDVLQGDTIHCK